MKRFIWSVGDVVMGEAEAKGFNPDQPRDDHGRWGDGGAYDAFESHMMSAGMSRTQAGTYDATSSADKPEATLAGEALAKLADENYRKTLQLVWDAKDDPFHSPADVLSLITKVGETVSKGQLAEGTPLWRSFDSGFYIPASEVQARVAEFSGKLQARLKDNSDPVGTAAMVEQELGGHIHPWSDGVGRGTRAIAAMALARAGHALPVYGDRKEFYSHINESPEQWRAYYATLFPAS